MITEEQRLARSNSIGGSDSAAVAGFSKWRTPMDVWREKHLKYNREFSNDSIELMNWGSRLESSIIDRYEELTGEIVTRSPATIYHKKYKFISANVDGIIERKKRILECKNTKRYEYWGEEGTDVIPDDYLCQVAHYCLVTDSEGADIAVLFQGSDFRIYKYDRNKSLEKLLIKKYLNFWNNNIQNGIEPESINIEDNKFKYKKSYDTSKEASEESNNNYEKIKEIKKSIKKLLQQEKDLIFKQQLEMGHHEVLINESGKTIHTWKKNKKNNRSFLTK